jgi:hypothetical protein
LAQLPPNLKELDCGARSLSEIPKLPDLIEELCIHVEPLSAAPTASSAQSSDSSSLFSGRLRSDMSRLPPKLLNLQVKSAVRGAKFRKEDFDLLPRTLRTLTLDLEDIGDANALLGLPALERIQIDISMGSSPDLICDSQLLEYLPSTLKDISIDLDPVKTTWPQWMRQIHCFPYLTSLVVSFNEYDTSLDPISLEFLPSLPDTIIDLELPLHRTTITPEQMNALPQRIEALTFYSMSNSESINYASDECFANLPKTLIKLHVPHDTRGLTKRVLYLLPSTLTYLSLPETLHPFDEYYAREPEWDGFRPF